MTNKLEPVVLHHAEELGQARAYTAAEAQALLRLALIVGLWTGALGLAVGMGCWLYDRYGWWTTFYILALPVGVIVGGGIVLIKGCHEQLDGLRSWREATTYAPPQPQPIQLPHPPIKVFPPVGSKKEPYLLTEPETPGRETLRLTPPVIAEIVQGVIERYDGAWSRRKLTKLTVAGGQKVSRSIYEALTGLFYKAGVLEQTSQGGFELVTRDLAELRDIFPDLPIAGGPGGEPGSRSWDGVSDNPPPGGGVSTLAQRHRLAYLRRQLEEKDV